MYNSTVNNQVKGKRLEIFKQYFTAGTDPAPALTLHQGKNYEPVGVYLHSKVAQSKFID
jgi:methenyltetrahydromethanopterin cyclohydrolase